MALSAFAMVSTIAMAQSSYTWNGNGGDDNFGTGANWNGGNAPSSLQSFLNFAGTTRLTPNNNYTAYSGAYQIYFNSGAGAFTIGGNALKFYNYGGGAGLTVRVRTSRMTAPASRQSI